MGLPVWPPRFRTEVYDITTRQDDTGRRCRVYLFEDDAPVLVDIGHGATVETLFAKLDHLGIDSERLVITHGDSDHAAGTDAIVDRYCVEVFAPAEEELVCKLEPDVGYKDNDTIVGFSAVHVTGHTPHHHALVHKERSIAVRGDAVVGAGLRGGPAGHFFLPPAVYSADLNMADESLENLHPAELDVALLYRGSSVLENAGKKFEQFVNFPGKPR